MSFPTTRNKKQGEPYDHMKDAAFFYDVTEQFKKGMKLDPQIKGSYEVTTISKVCIQYSKLFHIQFSITLIIIRVYIVLIYFFFTKSLVSLLQWLRIYMYIYIFYHIYRTVLYSHAYDIHVN